MTGHDPKKAAQRALQEAIQGQQDVVAYLKHVSPAEYDKAATALRWLEILASNEISTDPEAF